MSRTGTPLSRSAAATAIALRASSRRVGDAISIVVGTSGVSIGAERASRSDPVTRTPPFRDR